MIIIEDLKTIMIIRIKREEYNKIKDILKEE